MNQQDKQLSRNPGWRSLLFVPATRDRYVEKAMISDADAVVIDLEDSVLPEEKDLARSRAADVARRLRTDGRDVLVRINRPFALAVRDIEAAVGEHVTAIMVTKAESAAHLDLLNEVIEDCERRCSIPPGTTNVFPLIETAKAVQNLPEICTASRVVAVACGDEDLAADLGCNPDSPVISAIKFDLVIAAAWAERHPVGMVGSIAEFGDIAKYRANLEVAKTFGLRGTLCIHPDQVAVANQTFSPSAQDIRLAEDIIEAARIARENGLGTTSLAGKMIDEPIVRRAQKLVERYGSIHA